MGADTTPMTIDKLMLSLRIKAHQAGYVLPTDKAQESAGFVKAAIEFYDLSEAIAGRHLGKPVRFREAFEIVYGRKL